MYKWDVYVSSFIQSRLTIASIKTSVTYSFSFHKLSIVSVVVLSLLACSITLVNIKLTNSPDSWFAFCFAYSIFIRSQRNRFIHFESLINGRAHLGPDHQLCWLRAILIIQSIVWTKGQILRYDQHAVLATWLTHCLRSAFTNLADVSFIFSLTRARSWINFYIYNSCEWWIISTNHRIMCPALDVLLSLRQFTF